MVSCHKTYIVNLQNKPGYEWVREGGETHVIVAENLQEALRNTPTLDTLSDVIYDILYHDRDADIVWSDHIDVEISVAELPAVGSEVSMQAIGQAMHGLADEHKTESLKALDEPGNDYSDLNTALGKLLERHSFGAIREALDAEQEAWADSQ